MGGLTCGEDDLADERVEVGREQRQRRRRGLRGRADAPLQRVLHCSALTASLPVRVAVPGCVVCLRHFLDAVDAVIVAVECSCPLPAGP
jgi:hypothetical protein